MTVVFAGAASAQTLKNCLVQDPPQSPMTTAISNVLSLGYTKLALQAALAKNPGSEACYTGLTLSKNVYQYYKFLFKIQVRTNSQIHNEFHWLYQDASVQAHHGLTEKPWVGVSGSAVAKVMEEFIRNSNFYFLDFISDDLMQIAAQSEMFKLMGDKRIATTQSAYSFSNDLVLVSWMTALDSGYPGFEAPVAVLVRKSLTQIEVEDTGNLASQILFPLESAVVTEQINLEISDYAKHLEDLSVLRP